MDLFLIFIYLPYQAIYNPLNIPRDESSKTRRVVLETSYEKRFIYSEYSNGLLNIYTYIFLDIYITHYMYKKDTENVRIK